MSGCNKLVLLFPSIANYGSWMFLAPCANFGRASESLTSWRWTACHAELKSAIVRGEGLRGSSQAPGQRCWISSQPWGPCVSKCIFKKHTSIDPKQRTQNHAARPANAFERSKNPCSSCLVLKKKKKTTYGPMAYQTPLKVLGLFIGHGALHQSCRLGSCC